MDINCKIPVMEPSKKELLQQIKDLQNKVEDLENKLDLAIMLRFGRSSEKVSPLQPELFKELNVEELEVILEEITVPEHRRNKKGRKPISDKIPRKEIIHDIPEEDKKCACGCEMSVIEEVVTERLQVIPEKSLC